MSENLDLVRSIYADWQRGDFDTDQMRSEAAAVFHIRDGTVTKLIISWDRDRVLADLGLTE